MDETYSQTQGRRFGDTIERLSITSGVKLVENFTAPLKNR